MSAFDVILNSYLVRQETHKNTYGEGEILDKGNSHIWFNV